MHTLLGLNWMQWGMMSIGFSIAAALCWIALFVIAMTRKR